jgi:putative ABC transport system permease protein
MRTKPIGRRGEAAGDLRTLTATGAAGRTRRALTASTARALTLLGVGFPLVTTVAAWLLAGREPPIFARHALD